MSNTKHIHGYEVKEDGTVWSVSHNWRGYGKRLLKQDLNADGYLVVRMTINGIRKKYRVHVLVANTHLPNKPKWATQLRHLDGNKLNNNASNLCWGTAKENADDREMHGKTSRGAAHSQLIKQGIYANR